MRMFNFYGPHNHHNDTESQRSNSMLGRSVQISFADIWPLTAELEIIQLGTDEAAEEG